MKKLLETERNEMIDNMKLIESEAEALKKLKNVDKFYTCYWCVDHSYCENDDACENIKESCYYKTVINFKKVVEEYYNSQNQKPSKKFMKKLQNRMKWGDMSTYKKLSKKFIKEY